MEYVGLEFLFKAEVAEVDVMFKTIAFTKGFHSEGDLVIGEI